MSTRINITLTEDEYKDVVKCYKNFISNHEWSNSIPTVTGYVAGIVMMTINRILKEEKL